MLSTTFHRLEALVPPFPVKSTGSFAPESVPLTASPLANVDVGSLQLSSAVVEQLVLLPVVGADAVAKTPWARLSEPYEVEI